MHLTGTLNSSTHHGPLYTNAFNGPLSSGTLNGPLYTQGRSSNSSTLLRAPDRYAEAPGRSNFDIADFSAPFSAFFEHFFNSDALK